jgi:multiple sugar transport system substrate-binding protein
VSLTITSGGEMDPDAFQKNTGQYLQKKFPNYTFTYIQQTKDIKVEQLIASNTPIDIVFETIGSLPDRLIGTKLNTDISDLVKKHNIDLDRFEPTLIQGMRLIANGGLYGLPVENQVMATYYNKDLFDKFGTAYPKDGMTWDDAQDLNKKLTRLQDGVQYLGLTVSPKHMVRLNQFSLPYVDPKTNKSTYGDDKWQQFVGTVFQSVAQPPGYKDYMVKNKNKPPYKDEFLKNKNLAMFIYLTDLQNGNKELDTMNWDMVSAPTFKSMPKIGTQPYPQYWNVTSSSKHKDEAMEVLKYLTSDEYQTIASKRGVPTPLKSEAVKKVFGQEYPKPIHWSSVFYNQIAPISAKSTYDTPAETPLTDVIASVQIDKVDLNTALRQSEEAANKAIAAAVGK